LSRFSTRFSVVTLTAKLAGACLDRQALIAYGKTIIHERGKCVLQCTVKSVDTLVRVAAAWIEAGIGAIADVEARAARLTVDTRASHTTARNYKMLSINHNRKWID
jgi:hypothetical protein